MPIQDRQFMFSISTLPVEARRAAVDMDFGFGERAFDVTDGDRAEQRVSVQALIANRLTVLGRVGVSSDQRDLRSSQQGELLYSVMQSPQAQGSVAFSAWRVDGNALVEKPYSARGDAVDLITTFGVSRRVLRSLHAGVELIGEDLEGCWEEEEAEGGARLLLGPSLRIAPPSRHWQVSVVPVRVPEAVEVLERGDVRAAGTLRQRALYVRLVGLNEKQEALHVRRAGNGGKSCILYVQLEDVYVQRDDLYVQRDHLYVQRDGLKQKRHDLTRGAVLSSTNATL